MAMALPTALFIAVHPSDSEQLSDNTPSGLIGF
jgi:hypothetical protein